MPAGDPGPEPAPALGYTPVVRAVASVLLLLFGGAVVVWNLPGSEIQRRGVRLARPGLVTVGADQTWSVFAPDPRRVTYAFEARLSYEDGSSSVYRVPLGKPWVGEYRRYRWQKVMEAVVSDSNPHLWPDFAAWVARNRAVSGRSVASVALVRRWYDLLPPGPGPARSDWREYTFFTWRPGSP